VTASGSGVSMYVRGSLSPDETIEWFEPMGVDTTFSFSQDAPPSTTSGAAPSANQGTARRALLGRLLPSALVSTLAAGKERRGGAQEETTWRRQLSTTYAITLYGDDAMCSSASTFYEVMSTPGPYCTPSSAAFKTAIGVPTDADASYGWRIVDSGTGMIRMCTNSQSVCSTIIDPNINNSASADYARTDYQTSDCSGTPVSINVPGMATVPHTKCDVVSSGSLSGNYCDMSGTSPYVRGTYFPSSDCTGTSYPYAILADGTCAAEGTGTYTATCTYSTANCVDSSIGACVSIPNTPRYGIISVVASQLPPSPPPSPPVGSVALTHTDYATADCSGAPVNGSPFYSPIVATAPHTGCFPIPGGHVRSAYCDMSGAVPMLQGFFHGSSDPTCTGTGMAYSNVADGTTCTATSWNSSSKFHCIATSTTITPPPPSPPVGSVAALKAYSDASCTGSAMTTTLAPSEQCTPITISGNSMYFKLLCSDPSPYVQFYTDSSCVSIGSYSTFTQNSCRGQDSLGGSSGTWYSFTCPSSYVSWHPNTGLPRTLLS
jgi:hypothetical protein